MAGYNLNWSITIQKDTGTSKSAGGEHTESWVTHATVWAEKIPLRGSERNSVGQEEAVREVKWIIRFDDTVKESMRILYNSEYYNITFIEEIGRGSMTALYTFKTDNGKS
jgi:SPP1 family predicted phage head-tail adaptor